MGYLALIAWAVVGMGFALRPILLALMDAVRLRDQRDDLMHRLSDAHARLERERCPRCGSTGREACGCAGGAR